MYWGLDTVSGVSVHTDGVRTFYPDTRVLGIRDGHLLLAQDVTGSEEYDFEDAAPDADLVVEGDHFGFPLTPYRLHRLPLSSVHGLDVETVAEGDDGSATRHALDQLGVGAG